MKKLAKYISIGLIAGLIVTGCGSEGAGNAVSTDSGIAAADSSADTDSSVAAEEAVAPMLDLASFKASDYVTLADYSEIAINAADIEPTDEQLQAKIDEFTTSHAPADYVAKNGDTVNIDYVGKKDDVAFDGGTASGYDLTLGSGTFIPGFEEQLVGFEIGKEGDVNVKFPEEYQAEELAGKDATFKCTVKAIKAKELPELNDEFASDVSEFDTLAEYKEDVKKKLVEKKTNEEKAKREDAVVKAVIEDSDMELPEAMVETQQRQIVNDFAQRLQMQGMNMDQYLQYTGNTVDKMLEQVKPQAIERIKSRLVLEAVAEKENITVSDEEFEKELEKMAEQYRMELSKLKELMSDAEKKIMKSDLAVQKAAEKADDKEEKPAKKTAAKKTTAKKDAADGEEKPKKTTRKKKTEE